MSAYPYAEKALDMHPWPIAAIDANGCLAFINVAFTRRISTAARGEHIDKVFRNQPQLRDAARAALAGRPTAPVQLADAGGRVTYRVSLKPLPAESGRLGEAALYLEPVEDHAGADREGRIAVLDNTLNQIFGLAYRCDDPKETLDRMVQTIVASGVADSAVIYVRHNDQWSVRHAAGLLEELKGRKVSERQVRPSLQALREDRVIVINDVSSADEDTRRWLSHFGVCAMMDVKIDVPWGDLVDVAVHYHSPHERRFTRDDENFLQRVGAGVTLALRNVGLIDELRKEIFEGARTLEELRRSQGQLDTILENIPVAVFVLNAELKLMRANSRFEVLFDVKADKVWGETLDQFVSPPLGLLMHRHCRQALKSKKTLHFEEILPLPGGGHRVLATSKSVLRDDEGRPYALVAIATDITQRKRVEEQMRHVADHDLLTGLPNRRLFAELLELELANARRRRHYVALLYLDLNRFKQINDELGHEAGDDVLKQVAFRLTKRMRAADVVARIGGDEFNVMLSGLPSPERVADIIPDLLAAFEEPFLIKGKYLPVTTSIGISIYPTDADTPEMLRLHADMAMYDAKRRGLNQFEFFSQDVHTRFTRRLRLEHELRGAAERGELRLLFQPMVETASLRIFAAEALVRWAHPRRGLLDPARFLPVAEAAGMVAEIEGWVFSHACQEARRWMAAGGAGLAVTVNVSARQFERPDLADWVADCVSREGLDPNRLHLEIRESVVMRDMTHALLQMRRLSEVGVRLALDNFGSGYSSLDCLERMPISLLKIDRSFVKDIAADPHRRAVVAAITALGHSLRLGVLAEGIETEQQLLLVKEADCDGLQGFMVEPPADPGGMLGKISSLSRGSQPS
jgi:diguanylate cyclase (GGDEF)-like protein/PAS domain S-box-containing protein